jgi:hypothetical protein
MPQSAKPATRIPVRITGKRPQPVPIWQRDSMLLVPTAAPAPALMAQHTDMAGLVVGPTIQANGSFGPQWMSDTLSLYPGHL